MVNKKHLDNITEYRGVKINRDTADLSSGNPVWNLTASIDFNIFEIPGIDKRAAMFASLPYSRYDIGVGNNCYRLEDSSNPTGYKNGIWDYTELFEEIDDILDNKIPERVKTVMEGAYINMQFALSAYNDKNKKDK